MGSYSITVLETGFGVNVPASFYLDVYAEPGAVYPVHPFSMTLLQGDGNNILVDTGFDPSNPVKAKMCEEAGITNLHSPAEILGSAGLKPEDISTVILTHAHFDHAGALDCYPNARFYIQKKEFDGWEEFTSNPELYGLGIMSFDPEDFDRLKKLKDEGRLVLLDGDTDLFPGISLILAGFGHSYGCQMVKVETENGLYMIMGDVGNRPENITGTAAFPFSIPNTKFIIGSPYYLVKDYKKAMKTVNNDVSRLIMSHDGTRRERYPGSIGSLGLGIFKIA